MNRGVSAQEARLYELPPISAFEIADDVRTHAAAGIAAAQVRLAGHLMGAGGDDNARVAINLLVAAARQGYPPALFQLGMLQHMGRGPGLDPAAALPLIERAAELGEPSAMRYAASLLFDSADNRDPAHGISFFTALAERGSREAASIVAARLLGGRGLSPDYSTAARWLRQSGGAWAQLWLAVLHTKGAGVDVDLERARELEAAALASATVQERVDFALQLATAAPSVRDGEWALRVIDTALSDPNSRSPMNLNVLAEVYASLGRFADALGAQEEAVAELGYDANLERIYGALYEQRLAAYRRRVEAAGEPR